jgi:hypothetical protein
MAIVNIHHLTEKGVVNLAQRAQAALQEKLIYEHRRGQHTYGNMRRECPLCQRSAA